MTDPQPPDDNPIAAQDDPMHAEQEDPLEAAREALARARTTARALGFRPGTKAAGRPRAGLGERRSPTGTAAPRDPQALGDEVERLVAARGWDAEVQVGSVVGRWPTIVGADVAAHVTPVAFEGSVLTVQADSTAWATQMTLLTSSVLARIEAEVAPDVVTQIVVKSPGGPSWRKGRLRAQGPGPRDTYG